MFVLLRWTYFTQHNTLQFHPRGSKWWVFVISFFLYFFKFIYDSHTKREREAETQAEGETGSMHREPDVGLDPGSPGLRPGPKAGAKPLRHPGIPPKCFLAPIFKW